MKEEISIRGKKLWIIIEPHTAQKHEVGQPNEFFTASYSFEEPSDAPAVILFLEDNITPKYFESPVQALEYATEKLRGSL